MFDFIAGNSYIDLKYGNRLYLEESYSELDSMMHNDSSHITVRVIDFLGLSYEEKTFSKSDILYYGT